MYGLTMLEEYLLLILKEKKKYDARLYPTSKRGKIALVKSKTDMIYGYANLVSVTKISYEEYIRWHIGKSMSSDEAMTLIRQNDALGDKKIKEAYAYNFSDIEYLSSPKIINNGVKRNCWIEFEDSDSTITFKQLSLF